MTLIIEHQPGRSNDFELWADISKLNIIAVLPSSSTTPSSASYPIQYAILDKVVNSLTPHPAVNFIDTSKYQEDR